ncbi:MAG TPA: hypothetical protein VGM02_04620 [Acidobacteriaceae bacterium]|jgi:hypothetical protein
MRVTLPRLAALGLPLLLAGCHAHPSLGRPEAAFIITVRNQGPDIHQLEVDYPNASFGRDALASGASFNYPPKLIGSGPVKVTFNDANGKSHTATGPTVQEGMRKNLVISIGEDEGVVFESLPQQAG